jgi:hypothetical protein
VRSSFIARAHAVGVQVGGADATLDGLTIVDMIPNRDGTEGVGVYVADVGMARANVTLSNSLVARNHAVGVLVLGSDAKIDGVIVRDTAPEGTTYGRGIGIESDGLPLEGHADIMNTVVDHNAEFGVVFVGATGSIVSTLARGTRTQPDGTLGDGFAIAADRPGQTMNIHASRVEASARAGVCSWAAAVSIDTTTLDSNAIDLVGETSAEFHDGGGNVCMDGAGAHACQVSSSTQSPPAAVK